MGLVADTREWETHVMQLRQSLENAVTEIGSLTDARVLRISTMLDEALVAHLREQKSKE